MWPAKGDLYVSKSAPRAVETGPWRQSRVEAEPQSRGDRAVEAESRGGRLAGEVIRGGGVLPANVGPEVSRPEVDRPPRRARG